MPFIVPFSRRIFTSALVSMPAMPGMEDPSSEPEMYNSEETTVITKGTTISGGIRSDTSLIVKGVIEGDVECQGKLTVTGPAFLYISINNGLFERFAQFVYRLNNIFF